MSARAQAPRFRAYVERTQGHSVLTMPRDEWEMIRADLQSGGQTLARLDVLETPLADVAHDASVIASVISRSSAGAEPEIEIYRHDPNDEPTPVNKDVYSVWEDIPSHVNFPDAVVAASTSNDANLREYLSQNVFIVKKEPDADHWLSRLPAEVSVVVAST